MLRIFFFKLKVDICIHNIYVHFKPSASLSLSSSHPCSLLVQQLHLSMGALPGREQSHRGAHVAGIHVRVFHEAVFFPQRITAL